MWKFFNLKRLEEELFNYSELDIMDPARIELNKKRLRKLWIAEKILLAVLFGLILFLLYILLYL